MKALLLSLLLLFNANTFAQNNANDKNIFGNKTGCFVLYSLNQKKITHEYNPKQCALRLPPQSTFKIPLSLMAFDRNLITQDTVFKWDGKNRDLPAWNHDQTAKSWMQNSTIWVSQEITPKLGIKKIKQYLKKFHYGNRDFSGDPEQNNALDKAWLNSSLKISANEQLKFMQGLVTNNLPVSIAALTETKANMFLETTANGWRVYGKTGSAPTLGWFIGFIQKGQQTYIFVTNFTDAELAKTKKIAGYEAKRMTLELLQQQGVFK